MLHEAVPNQLQLLETQIVLLEFDGYRKWIHVKCLDLDACCTLKSLSINVISIALLTGIRPKG